MKRYRDLRTGEKDVILKQLKKYIKGINPQLRIDIRNLRAIFSLKEYGVDLETGILECLFHVDYLRKYKEFEDKKVTSSSL